LNGKDQIHPDDLGIHWKIVLEAGFNEKKVESQKGMQYAHGTNTNEL